MQAAGRRLGWNGNLVKEWKEKAASLSGEEKGFGAEKVE